VILTGWKKTQLKKTPISNRRIYCTIGTALTPVPQTPSGITATSSAKVKKSHKTHADKSNADLVHSKSPE
jgi:hypothetical protein